MNNNALEARFEAPVGWQFETIRTSDLVDLRWGRLVTPGARAAIAILPGFGEPIEKYFELIRDFAAMGLSIAILDLRGQGGSDRYRDDPHLVDSNGIDEHVNDVADFLARFREFADLPMALMGNSFGGHVALRFMHDFPDAVSCAVLTTPMVDINYNKHNAAFIRLVARLFSGPLGGHYVFGAGPYRPDPVRGTHHSLHSSDPARDKIQAYWYDAEPELQVGGQSWRWLYEAQKSITQLRQPGYLSAIQQPILMFKAGMEAFVSNEAIVETAAALPQAELYEIEVARHEIWMENDTIRQDCLMRVGSFLRQNLGLNT